MRAIIIEEKDIASLIEKLELEELKKKNYITNNSTGTVDEIRTEMHRSFHYIVVNWVQEQGSTYPSK